MKSAESKTLICMLSHIWLFVTLWTVALQALLSMGISRQEYCSGLPCPPPGNLSNLGIVLLSCDSCIAGKFFTTEPLRRYIYMCVCVCVSVYIYMYTHIYTLREKKIKINIFTKTQWKRLELSCPCEKDKFFYNSS